MNLALQVSYVRNNFFRLKKKKTDAYVARLKRVQLIFAVKPTYKQVGYAPL